MNKPVTPSPSNRAENIFSGACGLPSSEREAHIVSACGDDIELLEKVKALIAAHDEAPTEFLDPPVGRNIDEDDLGPTIDANGSGRTSGKPAPPPAHFTEKEGDLIGPYKLLQQIGEGGFGTVWMAEQSKPITRKVALKVIKAGMDTREVLSRFEAERQALAMMDHPNIAKVLEAGGTKSGRPYFAMELVKGIPITEYCDECELTTEERLELFSDVCSAINHAHQKGIIHRDIKPSNVMITLHADKPVVKVIDFGIAKATQGKLTDQTLFTRYEQFLGTPVYMSPEQAAMSGLDIDTRSDIYALGILLYELLTGKPPFDSQTLLSAGYDEMRRIIREVEPVKPSFRLSTVVGEERTQLAKARHVDPEKLDRTVQPDLDWIVMKAIDKERSRRYETANGLARDIARFLSDEPVSATPPSAGYRFRKFARRNRTALNIAAAISVMLVAGTIVSTWQAIIAKQARTEAEQAHAAAETEAQRARAAKGEADQQRQLARSNAYAADLLLCRNALANHNSREAQQLLNRHRPVEGEEDLRDWEWRHLWARSRSDALFELGQTDDRVCGIVLGKDGRSLYSFKDRGEIRHWNLESRATELFLPGSEDWAFGSSSSYLCLSDNGEWMAGAGMAGEEYVVRVWNLRSKEPPIVLPMGKHRVSAVLLWNREGKEFPMLGTVSPANAQCRIWNVGSKKLLHEEQLDHEVASAVHGYLGALDYYRGGDGGPGILAIGGKKQVVLLEKGSWRRLYSIELKENVGCLAFSPDGRFLAMGFFFTDPRVKILNVATGEIAGELQGHAGFGTRRNSARL